MERRVGGEKGRYRRLRRAHRAPISVLMRLKVELRAAFLPQGEAALFFSTTDGIPRQWYRDPSGQN